VGRATLTGLLLAAATTLAWGSHGDGRDRADPSQRGGIRVSTIATGLQIPWEIAFVPGGGGKALITERPGRVRLLTADGRLRPSPVARIAVDAAGEGGLLGLAFDPGFRRNRFVYVYLTRSSGMKLLRYRFQGGRLRGGTTVLDGIAAGSIHDSGRIAFGPDRRLYVATGDAGDERLPQDPRSRNGKFLSLGPDQYHGRDARPRIVSRGHRNPQGLDWQPGTGRLVATEHGDTGCDEVNVIRQGGNYGWPDADCRGQRAAGFKAPIVLYEAGIAPSGATFVSRRGSAWTGDYLVAGLRGEQISRVVFAGRRVARVVPMFVGRFGRLRTVVEGPGGALYALTSNRDGRGDPRPGDDRVLRIVPPR
jgi:glucose/arabinose dehydrogenase